MKNKISKCQLGAVVGLVTCVSVFAGTAFEQCLDNSWNDCPIPPESQNGCWNIYYPHYQCGYDGVYCLDGSGNVTITKCNGGGCGESGEGGEICWEANDCSIYVGPALCD